MSDRPGHDTGDGARGPGGTADQAPMQVDAEPPVAPSTPGDVITTASSHHAPPPGIHHTVVTSETVSAHSANAASEAASAGSGETADPATGAGGLAPISAKSRPPVAHANRADSRSPSTVSISSDTARLKSPQLVKLLPASGHAASDHQLAATGNFVNSTTTTQHLAHARATAAVAPADANSSTSTTNQPPTLVQGALASSTSAHAASSYSLHAASSSSRPAEQKHDVERPSAGPANGSSALRPSSSSRFTAIHAQFRSVFSADTSAPPTVTQPVHARCECLVVDESRLAAGTLDRERFEQALNLAADHHALQALIIGWINIRPDGLPDDVSNAFVPAKETRRLHINFTSPAGLARALERVPFLVRCGSIGTTGVWNTVPCGPARHECLELLTFTCHPTQPKQIAHLTDDVKSVLHGIGIDYTALWFGTSRGTNATMNRHTWYVLPRRIDGLRSLIESVHNRHELWGGKIRVHAPNTPDLQRCTQCDALGLAIRFLFKETCSFHGMKQLVAITKARAGFLGSSIDEMKPSHRVTLLFDGADGTEEAMKDIVARVKIGASACVLLSPPRPMDVRDRKRECFQCGEMEKPHECPFARKLQTNTGAHNNTRPVSFLQQGPGHGGASTAEMCHSWRATKKCTKKERGVPCPFAHPPEHVPTSQGGGGQGVCFHFQERGHCNRGTTCTFKHQAPSAPHVQVATVAAPQPTAAAPSAVSTAAPAPPVAAAAPSSSPVRTSSSRKNSKRVRAQESKEALEDADPAPSDPQPISKKSKASTVSPATAGIPQNTNRYAAVAPDADAGDDVDADMEEEKQPTPLPPPVSPLRATRTLSTTAPLSSLSTISSPLKTSTPSRRGGRGGKA